MSFQQGLSGLSAAAKSLDAIGNNVANANTVGFKASTAQFADVYASSLTGAGSGEVGIGVKVASVVQQFTQGNITGTANPLDVAINGGGFFRMSDQGTITYARNGQFQLDQNGYIVNSNGSRLTGYAVNSAGVLSTGAPVDLNINTADLMPSQTTEVTAELNLDSRKTAIDQTVTPFDINNPESYHNATSVSVYDSLGNSHVLQTYFVKTSPLPADPPGTLATWEVYGAIDGAVLPVPVGGNIGSITFTPMGNIDTALTTMPFANVQLPVTTGAVSPIGGAAGISIDFSGSTQVGSAFSGSGVQDGFAAGRLSGFNIGEDGIITGRYTNGRSSTLGQVVLANFTNPNGLQPLGNNVWAVTSTSGPEQVGTPGSGSMGAMRSNAVEDSNVDLTAELVNMITAQRYYQANAQTIKTQDQVMQTLVNLR